MIELFKHAPGDHGTDEEFINYCDDIMIQTQGFRTQGLLKTKKWAAIAMSADTVPEILWWDEQHGKLIVTCCCESEVPLCQLVEDVLSHVAR